MSDDYYVCFAISSSNIKGAMAWRAGIHGAAKSSDTNLLIELN